MWVERCERRNMFGVLCFSAFRHSSVTDKSLVVDCKVLGAIITSRLCCKKWFVSWMHCSPSCNGPSLFVSRDKAFGERVPVGDFDEGCRKYCRLMQVLRVVYFIIFKSLTNAYPVSSHLKSFNVWVTDKVEKRHESTLSMSGLVNGVGKKLFDRKIGVENSVEEFFVTAYES